MLDKNKIYALVGASNNKEKYGYIILDYLKKRNFKITPINPKEKEILGLKVFKNISLVPNKIDTVIFVVPPTITEKVLNEVKKLKIKNVWLQPESESKTAIEYCKNNNINCIHHACLMQINNKV